MATIAPDRDAMLVLRGVSFRWTPRSPPLLSAFDLDIWAGERVALMGPSGVGKTTLCRLMAGLLHPTEGEILLRGRKLAEADHEVTISFQDYSCFPWLTVAENTQFGIDTTQSSEREYAHWLLEELGLAQALEKYPKDLSGGMRQRVSIARALAVKPSILILDEPFSALDIATKSDLIDLLQALGDRMGFTLVCVLHNISDAYRISNRAIVLHGSPVSLCLDIKLEGLRIDEFDATVTSAISQPA